MESSPPMATTTPGPGRLRTAAALLATPFLIGFTVIELHTQAQRLGQLLAPFNDDELAAVDEAEAELAAEPLTGAELDDDALAGHAHLFAPSADDIHVCAVCGRTVAVWCSPRGASPMVNDGPAS